MNTSHIKPLRFAETLKEDGELFVRNLRDARVTDIYVVRGDEKKDSEWAPRFVYHGFRYVEVTGYKNPVLSDFVGEVVSDAITVINTMAVPVRDVIPALFFQMQVQVGGSLPPIQNNSHIIAAHYGRY